MNVSVTVLAAYATASLAKGENISIPEMEAITTVAYAAEVRASTGELRAYHARTFAERIERLQDERAAETDPRNLRDIDRDIAWVRDEARRAGVTAAEMEAARA